MNSIVRLKHIALFTVLLLLSFTSFLKADDDILKAMKDEIKRSMSELHLESLERPCYIEYTLSIKDNYAVHSVLGSLEESSNRKNAVLNVTVHVGSYNLNNSNFFDFGLSFFGSGDEEESFSNRTVALDMDYNSLRRDLWLATDAAYKQASEIYSKKLAFIKNRMRKDTTPDFTFLSPEQIFDTIAIPKFDKNKYEELCKRISAVFLKYPEIQQSTVGMEYLPSKVYYVNSEGREYIKNNFFTGFEILSVGQANDGMPLANIYSVYGLTPDELPTVDSLLKAAEENAKHFIDIKSAPAFDEPYSGPILFEGQAAAQLFAQVFAPNLVTQRQPLTEDGVQESERFTAFQSKIGGRVLPEFMNVISEPLQTKSLKTPLTGHYLIDDEGVPAQDITLVKEGYLKTLLSTRIPTKRVKQTNGSKRGGAAMYAVLELTSDKKFRKSRNEQIKQMIKLCKDRELPYGIVIRKIMDQNMMYTTLQRVSANHYPVPMGLQKIPLVEVYKVYQNGKEELVRGCEGLGFTAQSFKDILNAGYSEYTLNLLAPSVASPYIMGGDQYYGATVIVPNLLFEDGEIKPVEGDYPKIPVISNPISKIK